MANNRRITLALPARVLRQVKYIAAQRHISVSQLLTQTLEEMATQQETDFAKARARHVAALEHAAELGTYGHATRWRDSLHDR